MGGDFYRLCKEHIMSITSAELARAGKAGLDFYLKNNPIDMVDIQRPLLKHLTAKKKTFGGAKEHIVEQIRKSYGSAGQWFDSADTLNYTNRDTLEQSRFPWYEFHDGMTVNQAGRFRQRRQHYRRGKNPVDQSVERKDGSLATGRARAFFP
jgi:hypothetical protein